MNRRLALSIGLGALLLGRISYAQEVTIGYQGLPYKSSGESNTGIQIADGVLLHAGIGVEAGYDTNVFYASTNAIGSSIFRFMPYAEITNATRTGPVTQQLTFDARAGLQYRHYGNSQVSNAGYADAWNPNAGLSLNMGGAQFGFGLADVFARIEDTPYAGAAGGTPTTNAPIQRTNNQASIEGRWAPGGGRLNSVLRFTNMVNIYGRRPGQSFGGRGPGGQLRQRIASHGPARKVGRFRELEVRTARAAGERVVAAPRPQHEWIGEVAVQHELTRLRRALLDVEGKPRLQRRRGGEAAQREEEANGRQGRQRRNEAGSRSAPRSRFLHGPGRSTFRLERQPASARERSFACANKRLERANKHFKRANYDSSPQTATQARKQ
jgi:hypothetical protein